MPEASSSRRCEVGEAGDDDDWAPTVVASVTKTTGTQSRIHGYSQSAFGFFCMGVSGIMSSRLGSDMQAKQTG
jgi:hypothetical protein